MPVKPPPETRVPVYVHCRPCRHEWAFAYTPIGAGKFCKLVAATRCPMCGDRDHVFMGQLPPEPADSKTTQPLPGA